MIGFFGSKVEYYLLLVAAFVSVIFLVCTQIVEPWVLIVFLSLPPAIKNIKTISRASQKNKNSLALIDITTAQHHFLFGLLFAIGLLISAFL